jgi:integration host factor subunit alpha
MINGGLGAKSGDRMSSNGTLTRADLAESVNRHIGLSRAEASSIVESILDHMSDALERGENVKISSFGTFVLRDKNQRMGRNPKTGVEVPIDSRRVLTFRASQSMRDRVAGA